MTIVELPVDGLREAPENPRVISDDAVRLVADSIERYGFRVPLVVKGSEVVCGHTRLQAARLLGLDVVPCVCADHLSDEQVREFRVVENLTHEQGGAWDFDKLAPLLDELDLERWFGPHRTAEAPEPPPYEPPPEAPPSQPVEPVDPDPVVRLVVEGASREDVERVLQRAVDDPDGGLP